MRKNLYKKPDNTIALAITLFIYLTIASTIFFSSEIGPFFPFLLTLMGLFTIILSFPISVPYFYLFLLFFSNILISINSGYISEFEMKVLLGLDFLVLSLLSCYAFIKDRTKIYSLVIFPITLICFYYLFGIINNGFLEATIYFRLLIYGILTFYLGNVLGAKLNKKSLELFLLSIGILMVIFSSLEFFLPHTIYEIFNINTYLELKYPLKEIHTVDDAVELNTRRLFNTNILDNILVLRPIGIILHSISSAYIFAIFFSFALFLKKYIFALIFIFGIVISGSKGAIAIVVIVCGYEVLKKINLFNNWTLIFGISLYIIATSIVSYVKLDPHIYSVLATLNHFSDNLWGQGMGYGGSIISGYNKELSLDEINGDSGFAVLLNMMGIFGLTIYLFYIQLIKKLMKSYRINSNITPMITALIALIANSIFQEEAFTSYSLGILMFLIGTYFNTYFIHPKKIQKGTL